MNNHPNSRRARASPPGRLKSKGGYLRYARLFYHRVSFQTLNSPNPRMSFRAPQIPNQRSRDRAPLRKFSTLIKRMVVELDRDPSLYPEGNVVEVWQFFVRFSYPLYGTFLSISVAPRARASQSGDGWIYYPEDRGRPDKNTGNHLPRPLPGAIQGARRTRSVTILG